jgi:hypothetical protein
MALAICAYIYYDNSYFKDARPDRCNKKILFKAKRYIHKQVELFMKTIYLHIGVHKTASTALQAFFEMNQQVLAHHNIHVIKPLDGHKFYSCFLYHHPWRAFLNAETVRSQWLDSFSKRLESISQDNILITSEFFCVLYKHLI